MSNELVSVSDMERMANAIAKSNLFGIKTPDQALALMAIAQAEGLHPGIVARDYHIIEGKPALKADAMLARFQAAGGRVEWITHTNDQVKALFSHPQGGKLEIDWTWARAEAANLTGKKNWIQYPRQMLRARVISEGIRAIFPAVNVGTYTPEEVQDMDAIEGKFEPVQQPAPEPARGPDPRPVEVQGQPIATNPPEQQRIPVQTPQQPQVEYASPSQRKYIQGLAVEAGVTSAEVYARYHITALAELPKSRVDDCLKWIRKRQEEIENPPEPPFQDDPLPEKF